MYLLLCASPGAKPRNLCSQCTGTIISSKYGITTKRCTHNKKSSNENKFTRFYYGIEDSFDWDFLFPSKDNTGFISKIYENPNADMSILRIHPYATQNEIRFDEYVQPACLPKNRYCLGAGTTCTANSWDSYEYYPGNVIHLNSVSETELCDSVSGDKVCVAEDYYCTEDYGSSITCKSYFDSVNGERYTLYGIGGECFGESFTRVSEHLRWIKDTIVTDRKGSDNEWKKFKIEDTTALGACAAGFSEKDSFDDIFSKSFSFESSFDDYFEDLDYEDDDYSELTDELLKFTGVDLDPIFGEPIDDTIKDDYAFLNDKEVNQEARNDNLNRCDDIIQDEEIKWPVYKSLIKNHYLLGQDCHDGAPGSTCRIRPNPEGNCNGRDQSAVYVKKQYVDDSWTDKFFRTQHFRCEFSNNENRYRWKRVTMNFYPDDIPSSFGPFEIRCGPPNCQNPANWASDKRISLQDGTIQNVNINIGRGGHWVCANAMKQKLPEGDEVPYGGMCYLRCDKDEENEGAKHGIECKYPEREEDRQWNRLYRLNSFLTKPKWYNEPFKSAWAHENPDVSGWKCVDPLPEELDLVEPEDDSLKAFGVLSIDDIPDSALGDNEAEERKQSTNESSTTLGQSELAALGLETDAGFDNSLDTTAEDWFANNGMDLDLLLLSDDESYDSDAEMVNDEDAESEDDEEVTNNMAGGINSFVPFQMQVRGGIVQVEINYFSKKFEIR